MDEFFRNSEHKELLERVISDIEGDRSVYDKFISELDKSEYAKYFTVEERPRGCRHMRLSNDKIVSSIPYLGKIELLISDGGNVERYDDPQKAVARIGEWICEPRPIARTRNTSTQTNQ